MRAIMLLSSLILAGCAVSPADVSNTGEHFHFAVKADPERFAHCWIDAIESATPAYVGTVRPRRDGQRVLVRLVYSSLFNDVNALMAVADLSGGKEAIAIDLSISKDIWPRDRVFDKLKAAAIACATK